MTIADPLVTAWLDDARGKAYADLADEGRALRDAARLVVRADPVAALNALVGTLGDLDEAHELLSWLEAPEIWSATP